MKNSQFTGRHAKLCFLHVCGSRFTKDLYTHPNVTGPEDVQSNWTNMLDDRTEHSSGRPYWMTVQNDHMSQIQIVIGLVGSYIVIGSLG